MSEIKKVSKKTLRRSFWNWFVGCATCGNYERMQGLGFAQSMVPVVKDLYADDAEGRKEAMLRGMEFFNTEPEIGAAINGLVIAMEEQHAAGAPIDGGDISGMKAALMGPLAGIGDALIQGVCVPILLALFIDLTSGGLVIAPVLYAVAMYALMIGSMWACYKFGYDKGGGAIVEMINSGTVDRVMRAAGIVGCSVMGALIAKYVSVKCGIVLNIGASTFNIQETLFDSIVPKILPMLLTLGCVGLIRKGWTAIKIIGLIAAGGLVLGFLGVLA